MKSAVNISRFLDEAGRITQLPVRLKPRLALLAYLADKFEPDTSYTEHEVNALCNQWHTFGDFFLLRRELVDSGLLAREPDGSRYWRISAVINEPENQ